MSKQLTALGLAAALEATYEQGVLPRAAAAELRRLHAQVEALTAAARVGLEALWKNHGNGYGTEYEEAIGALQAALEVAA